MAWLLVLVCVGYLLYKLMQLYGADGDLAVLNCKMKAEYFKGRIVWVTGASSGIGEEMCYQLSKMGAKLILSARNKEKMEEVMSKLSNPADARLLPVDLSDPEATRTAAEKAKEFFGKIDILVNNAGVSTRSMFVDVQEHVARQVMEVNYFAPWILTHDLIKDMMKEGFGHVVNISSILGKASCSNRSTYSPPKFAIIGLMDAIRHEMQGSNVHITNVLPGPVATQVAANALTADGSKFGTTDDIVANGMTVQRCAEMTLIGVSNKLNEVWVAQQPWLMVPYLAHYCPSLLHYFLARTARKQLEAAKKTQ